VVERNVLIVDENETLLAVLAEMIAAAGHNVVSCRCFEEGRRHLYTGKTHAIVSSVRLGDYNGLHLVLLARALAPEITAVVYSDGLDSGILEDAGMAGATHLCQDALRIRLLSHLHACFARTVPDP
jgi:DNA-binding NtrC family response regulator